LGLQAEASFFKFELVVAVLGIEDEDRGVKL